MKLKVKNHLVHENNFILEDLVRKNPFRTQKTTKLRHCERFIRL